MAWKQFITNMQTKMKEQYQFDAAKFDDPVAMQTEWSPAKSGGSNMRTHKLVQISLHRQEFKPTLGAYFFCGIFFIVGIGVIAAGLFSGYNEGLERSTDLLLPVLFGGVFAAVGAAMYYFMLCPVVFDKQSGYFWKSRTAPGVAFDQEVVKNVVPLKQIHAIQLISERCRSKNSSYTSYELNLVLHDGKRVNVVDHGNKKAVRADAATLSEFLAKPVWDTI